MAHKVHIARSDNGNLTESRIVEGDIAQIAKEIVNKAVKEWKPLESDLTALKTEYELRYKLPIKPEILDTIESLNLQWAREGKELIISLPIIVISFDNKWEGDSYIDNKMYTVTYYIDDESKKQIEEYITSATKAPKELK